MEVGKDASELPRCLLVSDLHNAKTGGSHEQVAVGPLQETGGIAVARLTLMVEEGDLMELLAVPRLQSAVHTEIEQAATVLNHTVHVVAGQRLVGLVLLLEDPELVTVVAVDAVTGGNPKKTVPVEIHLGHETARQLMVVSCEEFAHLSIRAQSQAEGE